MVSAFGERAAHLAAEVGDGLWTTGTRDTIGTWQEAGGSGPVYSQITFCWAPDPPIYQPELVARRIVSAAENPPRHRIVGTWNWLIVQLAQLLPGVADHFMAATGVEGQLTDREVDRGRRDNLDAPVDDDVDHGARGGFDERAHGVLTPTFARSLPSQAAAFAGAVRDRSREVWQRLRGDRR